jgi:hypothetical protein
MKNTSKMLQSIKTKIGLCFLHNGIEKMDHQKTTGFTKLLHCQFHIKKRFLAFTRKNPLRERRATEAVTVSRGARGRNSTLKLV